MLVAADVVGAVADEACSPSMAWLNVAVAAGMVKRYHGSFPSFSYGFDSRYPLHISQFCKPFHANRISCEISDTLK